MPDRGGADHVVDIKDGSALSSSKSRQAELGSTSRYDMHYDFDLRQG